MGGSVCALADSLEDWRQHRAFPQTLGQSEGTEWRAAATNVPFSATQNQHRGLKPFSPEVDALFVHSRALPPVIMVCACVCSN